MHPNDFTSPSGAWWWVQVHGTHGALSEASPSGGLGTTCAIRNWQNNLHIYALLVLDRNHVPSLEKNIHSCDLMRHIEGVHDDLHCNAKEFGQFHHAMDRDYQKTVNCPHSSCAKLKPPTTPAAWNSQPQCPKCLTRTMNGAAVNGAMHFQSRVSEGKLSTSFRFFVLSLSLSINSSQWWFNKVITFDGGLWPLTVLS